MPDQTLQDWRKYQQCRRTAKLAKMDDIKTYPCLVLIENYYVEAYLKIIENTTKRYILIVSRKRTMGSAPTRFYEIQLASLRGYETDNSNIILTLQDVEEVEQEDAEEVQMVPVVLQFVNPDTLDIAFAAIREFGRERVKNLPTPQSTASESD